MPQRKGNTNEQLTSIPLASLAFSSRAMDEYAWELPYIRLAAATKKLIAQKLLRATK